MDLSINQISTLLNAYVVSQQFLVLKINFFSNKHIAFFCAFMAPLIARKTKDLKVDSSLLAEACCF